MVNAWSLLGSILNGTLDEDYPIMTKNQKNDLQVGSGNTASQPVDGNITISGIEGVETIYVGDQDFGYPEGLDYESSYMSTDLSSDINVDEYAKDYPSEFTTLSDNDDQIAHHISVSDLQIQADSPYNDGWTQQAYKDMIEEKKREPKRDGRYKYHETEIMNDIEDYVSGTYNGHYTGTKHEFRNIQTIDLMASRDLASDFCQSNILKYGSRYGSKDGKNKKDLMKVIHYAMLLLHFDGHYGTPSTSDGTFEQMP